MAVFLTMPVRMALVDDPPLQFSAMAITIALLVFLIWRGDTHKLLVCGKTALIAMAAILVTAHHVTAAPDLWVALAMALCSGAAVVYFHIAQVAVKSRIERSRSAALRHAEDHTHEAVGRLSGGIAHDFNNLLTAIRGNLELARMVTSPQERDDLLTEAQQAADRAARLVRHLLSYSRTARIAPELVNVPQLLDEVGALAADMGPVTALLSVDRPAGAPHLVSDPALLTTALLALIMNAAEAQSQTPGQAINVAVTDTTLLTPLAVVGDRVLRPGRYVRFSVRDSGPGIAPAILPHVAEPFFSTKPTGQASGMGLAMVTGFAEQCGGGLSIETSPSGTTVHLLLPPRPANERVANSDTTHLRAVRPVRARVTQR
jgi:signal transduction histidine kinase